MEEKRKRLHQALDEACEHGLGEFNIKIKEDGEFSIQDIRWKKMPQQSEVTDALELLKIYGFGGLEVSDGTVVLLKRRKRIDIR